MRLVVAPLLLLFGCWEVQPHGPEFPAGKEPPDGYAYCGKIAEDADELALAQTLTGWTVMTAGAGTALAGALVPASKTAALEFRHKFGSGAAIAGGAILIYIGQALLKRADATSKLAGAATAVLGQQHGETTKTSISGVDAAAKCSVAWGAWHDARSDSNAIANKLLDFETVKNAQAKQVAAQSQEALKDALAAKDAAEQAKATALEEKDAEIKRLEAEKQGLAQQLEILNKAMGKANK